MPNRWNKQNGGLLVSAHCICDGGIFDIFITENSPEMVSPEIPVPVAGCFGLFGFRFPFVSDKKAHIRLRFRSSSNKTQANKKNKHWPEMVELVADLI